MVEIELAKNKLHVVLVLCPSFKFWPHLQLYHEWKFLNPEKKQYFVLDYLSWARWA